MTTKPTLIASSTDVSSDAGLTALAKTIKRWGTEAGFQQVGITYADIDRAHKQHYQQWLAAGYHGDMGYLTRNQDKRTNPKALWQGTERVICFRMDYHQETIIDSEHTLSHKDCGYVARYALGRDYHKVLKKRIAVIGSKLQAHTHSTFTQRAYVDSAPVMERVLAQQAGLGWQGKHTLLINPKAGSLFFLGQLFTNIPLPVDQPFTNNHCGRCTACLSRCPTDAFVAPYVLDARKCIAYLTIEYRGRIPELLRPLMGNRVFGCDDCQLICPWNRFNAPTQEADFQPRHGLDHSGLLALFLWDEPTFSGRTEGSAIRRITYQQWLRNLAVGLGNAPFDEAIVTALEKKRADQATGPLAKEHIMWAIQQQQHKRPSPVQEFLPDTL